jgi:succinate dehydrogenase flavin-adding protein (antitoxin of CptAB toxin-antitoxin module)
MTSTQKRICCFISASLLLICLTSPNGWLHGSKTQLLTTARGAEYPIQFQGDPNEQLRKLLQERYDVLRAAVGLLNQQYSAGRVGILEIRDAIIEMFHAEAEMSSTNTERIKVYEKLVTLLQEQDKRLAEVVNAGRVTQMEFLRARASTLQAEIDLEKLRLPKEISQ